MPLQYKIDVLAALKEKGYNTNKIRTEGLLSQSTLQKFRNKQGVSWENLEMLCSLLDCQPGDLIKFVKEPVQYNSWCPARQRRLQKRKKSPCFGANFVQGITDTLLRTSLAISGKIIFLLAVSNLGWASLPLNDGFNPEDGFVDRWRENVQ